jgi:arylsulfatase A-like enzyme
MKNQAACYSFLLFVFLRLLSINDCLAQKHYSKSPNIIFIVSDDQGYGDLGNFFQNQRAKQKDSSKPFLLSPQLDKLANEGAMLTQYYCAAPICAPSRASIMLGVTQGHSNIRDNQFDKALEDNYTIASTLRTLGYSTAAIGKWGLQGNDKYDIDGYKWPAHPLKRGFDYYFGYMRHSDGHEHYPKEALYKKYWAENGKSVWENYTNITQDLDKCYTADLWTAAAKRYIMDHVKAKKKDSPFFLYLAFDTPHAAQELPTQKYPAGGGRNGGIQWVGKPGHFINTASGIPDSYTYPEYANATYDHDDNTLTPKVEWPEIYKRYATANRRIDDAVGDIVQLIRDLKLDSNTIIVYTSDNGPSKESYLPEDKYDPNSPTFFSSYGPFEGIKGDTWEGGIHLPAIVWWPKHILSGSKISTPVIAYDWAPTFINLAGGTAPARMDGISVLPLLTGRTSLPSRPIYIEYKNEESTPDYQEFSSSHRGRIRGQMQWIRVGDYAGIRYNVKSPSDDFEIYNVVSDPSQRHNLVTEKQTTLPHSFPLPISGSNNGGVDINGFQSYLKDRVLQMHRPNSSVPRPYDSAYIPSVIIENVVPGVSCSIYKGSFPWIPQVIDLKPVEQRHSSLPDVNASGNVNNTLSVFGGYMSVPQDGEYTFYMSSDAKAFLRLHDVQVIDEDYAYPGNLLRSASIFLKAGLHPFSLSYYRSKDTGPPLLKLDWSSTNMPRQRMQKTAFFRDKEENVPFIKE